MSEIVQKYDLEDYEDFLNKRQFAGLNLAYFVSEVQRLYCADKKPWVVGFSGGKDSTAIMTLVYLSLLGLDPKDRTKPVFVISSDTLVETPVVVDMITGTLDAIQKGAKRDGLPITTHLVQPKGNQTFWVNLLGKGYPAPTRSFRWCTERIKIDPVSDFIKQTVSKYDEVVVVLGSRSEESSSRAQVIAKHKLEGSRLARHTTLSNAYVYTPIETWSVNDVWDLLRGGYEYSDFIDEWESPWGISNMPLWTLYMHSSNQGECPLVIDESTPSCGNSRFGCWTCTVVTKDKAMEALIENGEEWMAPLLHFRDLLAHTTEPANKAKYRNYKRRDGKIMYQRAKKDQDPNEQRNVVLGPYWLDFRKELLTKLLTIEKNMNDSGKQIVLITKAELHEIRREWLNDPNEPDWNDSLPSIYKSIHGVDLSWVDSDKPGFDSSDSSILEEIAHQNEISPDMLKKLLDLEISMEGLSRRSRVHEKITSILKKDWSSLEQFEKQTSSLQARHEYDLHLQEIEHYENLVSEVELLLKKTDSGELL